MTGPGADDATNDDSNAAGPRSRRHRTRARAWALQVLYRWESADAASVRNALEETLATRYVAPERREYLIRVVHTFAENAKEVRAAVSGALDNWRIDRLARVDRCILFLSVTEMLFVRRIPPAVAIQEGVRLAQRYGSDHSARFVNGVLDAVFKNRGGSPPGHFGPGGSNPG